MVEITPRIATILDGILMSEGRYQDDPADTGNWLRGKLIGTMYGITPAVLASWRKVSTLTVEDMKALSVQEAREIYHQQYVKGPGYEHIHDEELQEALVDAGVNMGVYFASTALQEAINMTNTRFPNRLERLRLDGVVGPKTLLALGYCVVEATNIRFMALRGVRYAEIVDRQLKSRFPEAYKATKARFLVGWEVRLTRLIYKQADEIEDQGLAKGGQA